MYRIGYAVRMKRTEYDRFRRVIRFEMDNQEPPMTITALADRLKVSRPVVSKVLSGGSVPSINRAAAYAKALGTTLSDILK